MKSPFDVGCVDKCRDSYPCVRKCSCTQELSPFSMPNSRFDMQYIRRKRKSKAPEEPTLLTDTDGYTLLTFLVQADLSALLGLGILLFTM